MAVDRVSRFLRRRAQVTGQNLVALEHDLRRIRDSHHVPAAMLIIGLVLGVTALIGILYAAALLTVNGGL